jgi:tungstate transport system substrate-binding protein
MASVDTERASRPRGAFEEPGQHMTRRFFVLLALLLATPTFAADSITLASTTSTEQSGLFGHILPIFEKETGIEVKVVAVGTGQALAIGAKGDADALLVHDWSGEHKFVEEGNGIDRRNVMFNDFVLIGPANDPAGIKGLKNVREALRKIAAAEAPFASRGDDSGTHRMELRLWKAAGVDSASRGKWYRETGSGMGPTLNIAAGLDAYVLADRATWANFKNLQNLVILSEGDPVLYNPYGSILVNPAKHPNVKAEAARRWHDWLTSAGGRAAIASYRINGAQVFFPLDGTTPVR